MHTLSQLKGLGPKSEQMLHDAGIQTPEELKELGAAQAYVMVQTVSTHRVSLNLLYAIEGAITGHHWTDVSKRRKLELLASVEEHERLANLFGGES